MSSQSEHDPGALLSVVVPTYRRAEQLRSCLVGLLAQSRLPDEIVIVRRPDDRGAQEVLKLIRHPVVREVVVDGPGQLAAMEQGVLASVGDIVAFTDDDAIPHRDWLCRIEAAFLADPAVGGVGGRDIVHRDGVPMPITPTETVGVIDRWGIVHGHHHRGEGPARDVDVLKGVNMAFRREALALPRGLRGAGAQVHQEVSICAHARLLGWRLRYDPAIAVDHHPGPRFAADRRASPAAAAAADAAYNLVVGVRAHGVPRWRRATYGLLIGDRRVPGVVRVLAAAALRERTVARAYFPSLRGQVAGLVRQRGALTVATFDRDAEAARPGVTLVAHEIHDRGGMEHVLAEMIRSLHDEVTFHVIARDVQSDLRPLVEWSRIRIPGRPFPVKFILFYLCASLVLLRRGAAVRHATGALVANRVDLATVHLCHADVASRYQGAATAPTAGSSLRRANQQVSRRLALWAERWTYRPGRVDTLVAVSEGMRAALEQHYPSLPVVVAPNCIDAERFRPREDLRRHGRVQLGYADDTVVALFVGGDWDRKGLPLVIDALATIDDPNIELLVVGPGDVVRMQRRAARSGLADRAKFLGQRIDVDVWCNVGDFFVLPSLAESFCLAAHEAAACGLPIIGTDVPGIRDLIGNNEGGLMVDRSTTGVAAAVARLSRDADARRAMGAEARHRLVGQQRLDGSTVTLATYKALTERLEAHS